MSKRSTDEMHALDIRKIARAGLLKPGGSFNWNWSRGGNVLASIGGNVDTANSVTLHYRTRRHGGEWQDKRYQVMVEWTACHLGGTRPWWNCPCCGRRVAVLWGGSIYACRQCQQINYESTRTAESSKPFDRAGKLRDRLGWVPGVAYGMGDRPKGMHMTTYARLLQQYTVHAQATLESTENLLKQINRRIGQR
jgi:hypothetical protein